MYEIIPDLTPPPPSQDEFIHKGQDQLTRCSTLHGEPRLFLAQELHALLLFIFLGWVILPHPQATSTDHGGPRTSYHLTERRRRYHFIATLITAPFYLYFLVPSVLSVGCDWPSAAHSGWHSSPPGPRGSSQPALCCSSPPVVSLSLSSHSADGPPPQELSCCSAQLPLNTANLSLIIP